MEMDFMLTDDLYSRKIAGGKDSSLVQCQVLPVISEPVQSNFRETNQAFKTIDENIAVNCVKRCTQILNNEN